MLLTPGGPRPTRAVDVRLAAPLPTSAETGAAGAHRATREPVEEAARPGDLVLHIGSAARSVHVRPLGGEIARLLLPDALPLRAGDRAILRDPARHAVVAGVVVLDTDPPPLQRRGAARRRAAELEGATGEVDPATEVTRRGAVRTSDLVALGVPPERLAATPEGVLRQGNWWIHAETWRLWQRRLCEALVAAAESDPLRPVLSLEAARAATGAPDLRLVPAVATAAGLEVRDGAVARPGTEISFGPAEAGLRWVEERLAADPFAAPEQPDLVAHGLGDRELAAAERAGRLVRVGDGVVLLPTGPARAMRVLAALPQPFTTSQARQAMSTTRRIAIPLLEHLDGRGWTRRIDAGHRTVVR